MDLVELDKMKTRIEGMSKLHHIEILKILKKNSSVKLNENKNGVFVNLSFLPTEVVDEMKSYVSYVGEQEKSILNMEAMQEECKKNIVPVEESVMWTMMYTNNKIKKSYYIILPYLSQ